MRQAEVALERSGLRFLAQGYDAGVNAEVQRLIGRAPRSCEQYATRNRSAWQGPAGG